MSKKYELVVDDTITFWGWKLFRIRALISFGSVDAGELGGYIQKEENLSQEDDAWVSGNAKVWGNAEVSGD
ncbi:TPA: polymer-forming cytoskeletal protein, partial [Streptococcus pyogenes]|nr:polymer-forming cytoskeletal protein [Streptococcus pyogenes]